MCPLLMVYVVSLFWLLTMGIFRQGLVDRELPENSQLNGPATTKRKKCILGNKIERLPSYPSTSYVLILSYKQLSGRGGLGGGLCVCLHPDSTSPGKF